MGLALHLPRVICANTEQWGPRIHFIGPERGAISRTQAMTIRIALADDHPVILAGLAHLFSHEADFQLVGTACDGNEALRLVRETAPHVLVLDLKMPRKDGIGVLREIKARETRVVVLTAVADEDALLAVRLGARGFVNKEMAAHLLVQCVRAVHAGGTWIEKGLAGDALIRLLERESATEKMADKLTRREIEVAQLSARGMASKHIARELAITEGTAKLHLHRIYTKLRLQGRVGLVRYMQRNGVA